MINRILAFLLFVVVLLAFGCGGGGGGGGTNGGSNSGGNGGNFGTTRVEAVDINGNYVSPQNIQVGDNVTFELAHYSSGVRSLVPVSGSWSTTDTTSQAGVLGANGSYTAQQVSATTYTVSATSSLDGHVYQASYNVKPVQAAVRGLLIDTNSVPVGGVTVLFYNASGTQIGSTVTTGGGVFYAALPTTATRFQLLSTSINSALYQQFYTYGSATYSSLITSCSAPLPTLTNGAVSQLPNNVILNIENSNPPPPPSGCQ